MDTDKSLDKLVKLIAAYLHSISMMHGDVLNTKACALTIKKVEARCLSEGIGFLTKTLPKLGKAFDKALSDHTPLNCTALGFKPYNGTKLPKLFGELFSRVLDGEGKLLPDPCYSCVKYIRQLCTWFYKYELPYTRDEEHKVVAAFKEAEDELTALDNYFSHLAKVLNDSVHSRRAPLGAVTDGMIAREARILLNKLFSNFDPSDIVPGHGPGVVSTKERLWAKYQWTNVPDRIVNTFPFDAYFCASLGHVCDRYHTFSNVGNVEPSAQVILVPKDSRGPRLISAEPVAMQWIQQGLRKAIVQHVERHPLTKEAVFFTDQVPNRIGALLGSSTGRYATLDLKEASDRVHLGLVRLLFPEPLLGALVCSRSLRTVLPDGQQLELRKFAPMGSALCFPVMALTIWSLLAAGAQDTYTRERIHVYGDDVIVPTAFAARAMNILESFGLKINRDKSCTGGLFRESCGMDAFNGIDVTPVKVKTVWSSTPSADVYTSWIAYANSFYDRRFFSVYHLMVEMLTAVYGSIPGDKDSCKRYPSLREEALNGRPLKTRYRGPKDLRQPDFQKKQLYVLVVKPVKVDRHIDGWSMLLRYFTELNRPSPPTDESRDPCVIVDESNRVIRRCGMVNYNVPDGIEPFCASSYTKRRTSMLVRRWR